MLKALVNAVMAAANPELCHTMLKALVNAVMAAANPNTATQC
jgi:hypothetical protein